MSDALGLSIGTADLVAARVGCAPVARRSVLTLLAGRSPEVGVPGENPNLTEPGLVLHGFIAGIGDPSPFVAPDGSTHRCDVLAAEALDAMARIVGYGASVAVAVPGYWGQNAVAALREALRSKRSLGPAGMPAALVSDATAALAALYAKPGFPTDGVVALCDFGASGTSVTLTDAASNFQHIGETVRYAGFSGDQVDQAILNRVKPAFAGAGNSDTAGTTPVGSLSRRLDECRRAKEQLSAATVTVVPAEMPGAGEDVRLSRTELEALIFEPLDRFVTTVEEVLRRTGVHPARLAAVATVGGGACIPLVTERLERRLHAPVVTTPEPVLSAAIGAAVFAEQQLAASHPAGRAAANPPADIAAAPTDHGAGPTATGAAAPTELDPAGWAAEVAAGAAGEPVADGAPSATYRALAWSQDASTGNEPLPYEGDDDGSDRVPPAVTVEPADRGGHAPAPARPPGHKRPGLLFGLAAMAALIALLGAGVVVFKLSSTNVPGKTTSNVPTASTLPSVGSLAPEPPTTETTTEENAGTAEPPPPSTTEPPTTTTTVPTTTTTPPTTTSTYSPVTTTPPPTTSVSGSPRLVPVKPTHGR